MLLLNEDRPVYRTLVCNLLATTNTTLCNKLFIELKTNALQLCYLGRGICPSVHDLRHDDYMITFYYYDNDDDMNVFDSAKEFNNILMLAAHQRAREGRCRQLKLKVEVITKLDRVLIGYTNSINSTTQICSSLLPDRNPTSNAIKALHHKAKLNDQRGVKPSNLTTASNLKIQSCSTKKNNIKKSSSLPIETTNSGKKPMLFPSLQTLRKKLLDTSANSEMTPKIVNLTRTQKFAEDCHTSVESEDDFSFNANFFSHFNQSNVSQDETPMLAEKQCDESNQQEKDETQHTNQQTFHLKIKKLVIKEPNSFDKLSDTDSYDLWTLYDSEADSRFVPHFDDFSTQVLAEDGTTDPYAGRNTSFEI